MSARCQSLNCSTSRRRPECCTKARAEAEATSKADGTRRSLPLCLRTHVECTCTLSFWNQSLEGACACVFEDVSSLRRAGTRGARGCEARTRRAMCGCGVMGKGGQGEGEKTRVGGRTIDKESRSRNRAQAVSGGGDHHTQRTTDSVVALDRSVVIHCPPPLRSGYLRSIGRIRRSPA